MTDKSPKLLVDALGAIGSAKDFVDGCTFADYAEDKMHRSAIERQLEILGEDHAPSSPIQSVRGVGYRIRAESAQ